MWTTEIIKGGMARLSDGRITIDLTLTEILSLWKLLPLLLGEITLSEFQKNATDGNPLFPPVNSIVDCGIIKVDDDNPNVFILCTWGKVKDSENWRKIEYRLSRPEAENLLETASTVSDVDLEDDDDIDDEYE